MTQNGYGDGQAAMQMKHDMMSSFQQYGKPYTQDSKIAWKSMILCSTANDPLVKSLRSVYLVVDRLLGCRGIMDIRCTSLLTGLCTKNITCCSDLPVCFVTVINVTLSPQSEL